MQFKSHGGKGVSINVAFEGVGFGYSAISTTWHIVGVQ